MRGIARVANSLKSSLSNRVAVCAHSVRAMAAEAGGAGDWLPEDQWRAQQKMTHPVEDNDTVDEYAEGLEAAGDTVAENMGEGVPIYKEEIEKVVKCEEVKRHFPADGRDAGKLDRVLSEDFSAEADWRRLATESEPSGAEVEREQQARMKESDKTHIHKEDIRDSDSSAGM